MTKIIWIWGGEFRLWETLNIDKEIVLFSNKRNPKFLFIPTASFDSIKYSTEICNYFADLWCKCDILYLSKNKDSKYYEKKILWSDIIYVWWWNSLEMMKKWRKLWIDKILYKALKNDIVLCWLSAWAICWFSYWSSDSRKLKKNLNQFIKVKWLWFVNALFCPHYDSESERKDDLKRMMKYTNLIALAVDDGCAIQVKDSKYRIIQSQFHSVYKIYRKNWKYINQKLKTCKKFASLDTLIQK